MPLDALVVLGCRVRESGRLSGAARRRVSRAAEVYHAERPPHVIVSGGRAWHGVSEAWAFGQGLLGFGVPEQAVLLEDRSLNTRQNAAFVRDLLVRRQLGEKVGIVTCDFHMRRALLLFQRLGMDPVAYSARTPPHAPLRRSVRALKERLCLFVDGGISSWLHWD